MSIPYLVEISLSDESDSAVFEIPAGRLDTFKERAVKALTQDSDDLQHRWAVEDGLELALAEGEVEPTDQPVRLRRVYHDAEKVQGFNADVILLRLPFTSTADAEVVRDWYIESFRECAQENGVPPDVIQSREYCLRVKLARHVPGVIVIEL